MSKGQAWGTAFLVAVVLGSCGSLLNSNDDEETVDSLREAAPATTTATPTQPYEPMWTGTVESAPAPVGETVTVTEVIDGDTFKVADGRTIRLIGVDSCEMGTLGGEMAKTAASVELTGDWKTVTLVEESGVDKDSFGRHLRYVKVDGKDLGLDLIQWDHTGIYTDKNGRQGGDASQEYLEQMRANDLVYASNPPSGRECGGAWPPPNTGGGDDDVNIDNDDDDGESRFCRKRWWC